MCIQSQLVQGPGGAINAYATQGVIDSVGANSFLLQASHVPPGHVVKMTHVPNNYTAMPPDPLRTGTNDRFTYTDFTAGTTPIATQIANQGGPVATAIATGLWPPFLFDSVIDNGSGGSTIQYRSFQQQDSQCMLAWADGATNTLLSSQPLFGGYPISYSACHFLKIGRAHV